MYSYYAHTTLISVVTCVLFLALVHGNVMIKARSKRLFTALFLCIAVASVCEYSAKYFDGREKMKLAIMVMKSLELSLAPFVSILYAAILMRKNHRTIQVALGLCAAHALFVFGSLPFGLVVDVNAAGVYNHGPMYFVYVVAYVSAAVFMVVINAEFSTNFQYRNRYLPWIVLCFALVASVSQMIGGRVRIVWLVLSIVAGLFYTLFCSVIQQADALTRLLNRASYEAHLGNLAKNSLLFFFDVDDFKFVNDTYGHDVGDEVLVLVAQLIYHVFHEYGSCYRIGGDEFCAIVSNRSFSPDNYVASFNRELDIAREEHERMPMVSIGYARYTPGDNAAEDAIKRADTMMYEYKRARKARAALEAEEKAAEESVA